MGSTSDYPDSQGSEEISFYNPKFGQSAVDLRRIIPTFLSLNFGLSELFYLTIQNYGKYEFDLFFYDIRVHVVGK